MTGTRVFIIHENLARLRQAADLLDAIASLRVIQAMGSVSECLMRVDHTNCDLILASATLPSDELRRLLKHLRRQAIPAKVIVTDLPNDPKKILGWIAAGAAGYVLRHEGVEAWGKQIAAVCSGQPLVSPAMAATMMSHLTRLSRLAAGNTPNHRLYANLTKREHEVLTLLGQGHTNQIIANQLILTVGTVKNHVHHVLAKLNLSNRKAAGLYLTYVS